VGEDAGEALARRLAALERRTAAKELMIQGKRSVDLNTLLSGANVVVMLLTLSVLGKAQSHPYVDGNSIALGGLLALQTQAALWLERRRRDPMVVLLAFLMIFFFSLRVFTLTVFATSDVFDRFAYRPHDTNFALLFVVLANSCLYVGLLAVRCGPDREIDNGDWRPASPAAVLVLIALSLALNYAGERVWGEHEGPRIFSFLRLFLSPYLVLLMALAYWLLLRKSLSRVASFSLAALILTEVVLHILYGSRSAIVGLIQNFMLIALAINGAVRIERKYAILGGLFMPVVAALLVWSFFSSTFIRAYRVQGAGFDPRQAVELAKQANESLREQSSIDIVLGPVFARVGFLDYSAALIANRDRYRDVVNIPTYFKSVIDNTLTPGFDVFDQPKVSNSLRFVYQGLGRPSKSEFVEKYGYQSDQLGLYGELYLLFGFASLPLFFVFAYAIKRFYVGLRRTNPFALTMKRLILLTVFLTSINSYGIDWVIAETAPMVVAIIIYSYVFAVERQRPLMPGLSVEASILPSTS
jgi:hypothetical protein